MTKTPRTDACFYEHDIAYYNKQNPNATLQVFKVKSVGIDFARQLETELNEAQMNLKIGVDQHNILVAENNRQRELIRQMLEALEKTCHKLKSELLRQGYDYTPLELDYGKAAIEAAEKELTCK